MAGRRNGNGARPADVPRWVRVLFDDHERLLAQTKAEMAQTKTEHEERMDEMERVRKEDRAAHEARMDRLDRGLQETRRLTTRVVDVMDALRRDHDLLVKVVREVHGRVSRLERK